MGAGRWILPFALVAVGLLWTAQGLGLVRGGSFMVGDVRWAVAGIALVFVGAALAVRRRTPDRR